MRLTDIVVKNLPSPDRGQKLYRGDEPKGFGVRVSQGGTKTFVLVHGAGRQFTTIGRYPVISLQDARGEAKRLMAEMTLGKHRPKRITFEEALDAFVETRKEKNRPKTAYETERLLRVNFKPLHAKQLSEVRAHHVTDITDALAKKGKRSLALHAFNAAHTFLRFCAQRHYIDGNPIAETEKPANNGSRERVLTDDELRLVWRAALALGGTYGRIVQLLILTGQRRNEIASLQGNWIGENCITLPAAICKNGRAHAFPIGTLTASIVQPCSFNGFSKAKIQLDERIAELLAEAGGEQKTTVPPWTLHDLRRTYATNLQRLKVAFEVREALLNHVGGPTRSGVAGVYARHGYWDEMVEAVATYEAWLCTYILGEAQIEEL